MEPSEDFSIKVIPQNSKGVDDCWRWEKNTSRENLNTMIQARQRRDGGWNIYEKFRGTLRKPRSIWLDSNFRTEKGTITLRHLFGSTNFDHPKPAELIEECIKYTDSKQEIILDFFAGSGTTGHAVINLNRTENANRKFILVEMGTHFYKTLLPRIKKVIYSDKWKDGKPLTREGSSYIIKYSKLESFEDTLNNLSLKQHQAAQGELLDKTAFGEDYLLHYMLDFESQNSLLDLERFETPFNYQLQISSSTVGETEATPVDLIETFNYLLGLHVQSICKIENAVVVRGTNRDEKQILVIWRTVAEMDNDQLNDFFEAQLVGECQEIIDIYVNGDNNLANIRPDDQHWTVHLTEESFHRLMFEG